MRRALIYLAVLAVVLTGVAIFACSAQAESADPCVSYANYWSMVASISTDTARVSQARRCASSEKLPESVQDTCYAEWRENAGCDVKLAATDSRAMKASLLCARYCGPRDIQHLEFDDHLDQYTCACKFKSWLVQ